MPTLAVILPAGGSSTRFGTNKLLAPLQGNPVLQWTIDAFAQREDVAEIILATSDETLRAFAPSPDTPGEGHGEGRLSLRHAPAGACRAESVRNALNQVDPGIEWVAIHDAARPLVSHDLIDRVSTAAREHGCAAPALPVSLTIKQASGPLPARLERTIPRHQLWAMQTPQIMRRDLLLEAYRRCPIDLNEITDDVQLLELAGNAVWLVTGGERNIKITTPLDLIIAHAILGER